MSNSKKILIVLAAAAILALGFFLNKRFNRADYPADAIQTEVDALLAKIGENPNSVRAYIDLAKLYRQKKLYSDAVRTLQQALTIKSIRDAERYEIHILLSEIYLEMGETDAAEKAAKEARRLDPRRAGPHNKKGQVEEKKGNEAEAVADYKRAEAAEPTDPESYLRRALIREKKGDHTGARKLLEEGVRRNAASSVALRNLAEFLERRTLYKDADRVIHKAIALDASDAVNHYVDGRIEKALGDAGKAIAALDKSTALDPKLARPAELAGDIFMDRKEYDEAVKRYEKSLAYDRDNKGLQEKYDRARKLAKEKKSASGDGGGPGEGPGGSTGDGKDNGGGKKKPGAGESGDGVTEGPGGKSSKDKLDPDETKKSGPETADIAALKKQGRELYNQGKFPEALAIFERIRKEKPSDDEGHYLAARTLEKLGRDGDAVHAYEDSLKRNPASSKPAFYLGQLQYKRGNFRASADAYRIATKDPAMKEARYNLAVSLEKAGDKPAAVAAYREAVKDDPADWRAGLNLGVLLKNMNQDGEALKVLDAAAAASPNQAALHQQKAEVLSRLGRTDQAIAAYAEAIRIDPKLYEAHFNSGLLSARSGKPADALTSFDRAVALRGNDPGLFVERARVLVALQRKPDAVTSLEKALSLEAGHAAASIEIVPLYVAMNREADALQVMDRAAKVHPTDYKIQFNAGNLFRKAGKRADARSAYRRAIDVDSSREEAYVNLALTHQDEKDAKGALAVYELLLSKNPASALGLRNAGLLCLRELGDRAKGETYIKRYLEKYPKAADAEEMRRLLK